MQPRANSTSSATTIRMERSRNQPREIARFRWLLSPRKLAKHPRGEKPAQLTASLRRKHLEIDAADAALLEFERRLRTDQLRRELAKVRLVADQRDAPFSHVLDQFGDDGCRAARGRERVGCRDWRLAFQRFRKDVRRLPRADQGAGDDLIKADVERVQARRFFS